MLCIDQTVHCINGFTGVCGDVVCRADFGPCVEDEVKDFGREGSACSTHDYHAVPAAPLHEGTGRKHPLVVQVGLVCVAGKCAYFRVRTGIFATNIKIRGILILKLMRNNIDTTFELRASAWLC